jgi:hypothetical protein
VSPSTASQEYILEKGKGKRGENLEKRKERGKDKLCMKSKREK